MKREKNNIKNIHIRDRKEKKQGPKQYAKKQSPINTFCQFMAMCSNKVGLGS